MTTDPPQRSYISAYLPLISAHFSKDIDKPQKSRTKKNENKNKSTTCLGACTISTIHNSSTNLSLTPQALSHLVLV